MAACKRAAFCLLLLLTLGQAPHCVLAGKILIWPGEFSHWLNVKVILEELIARGHNLTIVTHSATPFVKTTPSPGYNVDIIQVPHTKQDIIKSFEKFVKYFTYDLPNDNMIQASLKIKGLIDLISEKNYVFCRNLFVREDLMEKWNKEEFEVLLTDPMNFCGELLAQKLNLPFIVSLRFSFGSSMERLCGQLPTPPSYVPGAALGFQSQVWEIM
ncbi:hypothetical protein MHYP_G00282980 [Metynnis hypsauchen]